MSSRRSHNDRNTNSNDASLRPTVSFRGLPNHDDVCSLVQTYLQEQHALWKGHQNIEHLPKNDPETISRMAESFEDAYRACKSPSFHSPSLQTRGIQVGAAYLRYSDANSNSRSLNQQLVNVLRMARQKNAFIPWPFVYADAAIPGTTVDRNGYKMLQDGIKAPSRTFDIVFVDELDRLNRVQIESHIFIGLLTDHLKRLIAADGFDSADTSSKITHSFKAMQNDFFNDQIKAKVNRGMEDAFNQGRNLGLPPLGYMTVPKLDESGNHIVTRHNKLEKEVVIDEEEATVVRRIFALYVEQKMSTQRIARLLNGEAAANRTGWNASTVRNLLKNERFIGVYVWRTRKGTKNPRTSKRMDVKRPESEQLRRKMPQWRIISDDLWEAAQKRLIEATKGTRALGIYPSSRQALYPTRLFDLYCKDCDRPLRLDRSGKYAHLCCANGKEGMPSCRLTHSKMLGIVDNCILTHLRSHFLDQSPVEVMLDRANAYLLEEAAKPTVDTAELDKKIQRETDRIKRLAERVANIEEGPGVDLLMTKISEAQRSLGALKKDREVANASNFRPKPIDREALECLFDNLRDLMQDDVVASNAVLAKALGRVYVTQGPKRGAFYSWIAELNINEVPVLIEIAKKSTCPTLDALDFLQIRSWTSGTSLTIELIQRNQCPCVSAA